MSIYLPQGYCVLSHSSNSYTCKLANETQRSLSVKAMSHYVQILARILSVMWIPIISYELSIGYAVSFLIQKTCYYDRGSRAPHVQYRKQLHRYKYNRLRTLDCRQSPESLQLKMSQMLTLATVALAVHEADFIQFSIIEH